MFRTRRQRGIDGASSSEYGLLVSGIAALIVAMVWLFGGAVADMFGTSCETIDAKMSGSTCAP